LILEPVEGLDYSINLFFIGGSQFVVFVVFVWRNKKDLFLKKLLNYLGDEVLMLAPSNSAVACVAEIWKGKSHSENSTNVFLSILRWKNLNAKTITTHFIFVLAETSGRKNTFLS